MHRRRPRRARQVLLFFGRKPCRVEPFDRLERLCGSCR